MIKRALFARPRSPIGFDADGRKGDRVSESECESSNAALYWTWSRSDKKGHYK